MTTPTTTTDDTMRTMRTECLSPRRLNEMKMKQIVSIQSLIPVPLARVAPPIFCARVPRKLMPSACIYFRYDEQQTGDACAHETLEMEHA